MYVSAASAWEIAIKQSLGNAAAIRDLASHHRDPFDRLIIAAARVEGLAIVTSDDQFGPYGSPLLNARE